MQKTDSYKAGQSLWITEKVYLDKDTPNAWYFFVQREDSESASAYFNVGGEVLKGHFVSIKKADFDLNCVCIHCAHCFDKQTGARKEICMHLWACLFQLRENMNVRECNSNDKNVTEFFTEELCT